MTLSKTMPLSYDYSEFLNSAAASQWKSLGISRRAGISAPLFSVYSKQSTGIGEIPDLKLLMDFCVKSGMSILQLLPMNDVGFDFRPYDAQSTFALEPVYLSLSELKEVPENAFDAEIAALQKKFPAGRPRVDYGVKRAKLDLLRKIFRKYPGGQAFSEFCGKNGFWLPDYALFKAIKETVNHAAWEDWPEPLKTRQPEALKKVTALHSEEIEFQKWLQWQLFEQFSEARQAGLKKGVFMMGDLPFLVSRDSADVWSHQDYFKLELVSGAPPDAFFSMGQRWGMPPYDWPRIAEKKYDYLSAKLKYAENFYDLFRIDHVVGAFRLWTIHSSEPKENHGLNGRFDPQDENLWESHGRTLLSVMLKSTRMLPCAEDLGVVPPCAWKALEDFGIPGMDVQRWTKEWSGDCSFRDPAHYRKNSAAVISNHDMSSFQGWWEFEVGTVDGGLFERKCREKGMDAPAVKEKLFDLSHSHHGRLRWRSGVENEEVLAGILGRSPGEIWDLIEMYRGSYDEKKRFLEYAGLGDERRDVKADSLLIRRALEKASESRAIFSIQLLQDLLDLGPLFEHDAWEFRINFPGSTDEKNWSLVIPKPLESIVRSKLTAEIQSIHKAGGRI